jgi:hypothetical protein
MHIYAELDAARRRQAAFRAEASAHRLAALARLDRAPARRLVAKLIIAIGFVVVDAGRRIDGRVDDSGRYRLRIVS